MCIDIITPVCCAHGQHNLTRLGCLTYPFQNISTNTGIDMKLLCTVVMHDDGKRERMSVEEVLVRSTRTKKSIRLIYKRHYIHHKLCLQIAVNN